MGAGPSQPRLLARRPLATRLRLLQPARRRHLHALRRAVWQLVAAPNLEAVPHANASFTYIDGDGTVPTESATAHGLDPTASVALKADHRGLVASQAVFTQVLEWLRAPLLRAQPGFSGGNSSSSSQLGGSGSGSSSSGGSRHADGNASPQPALLPPALQCISTTASEACSLAEPLLAAERQRGVQQEERSPLCCARRW